MVTKEQFLNAYNNHLPNKYVKFIYRFFSKSTKKSDKWLKRTILYILLGLFTFSFINVIFDIFENTTRTFTFIYAILLAIVVIVMWSAGIMNNRRIIKICNELHITRNEYDSLVSMYIPE